MEIAIHVPPLNFSIVAPGVYRSGYPNRKNYPFLKNLGLQSVIYLCPDDLSVENITFYESCDIQLYHLPMQGNKEPFTRMDKELIVRALQIMLDTRNHPILVHCNKGKHRVGCVMGILRKLQNWSMASIFDEYRRFAGWWNSHPDKLRYPIIKGTKTRIADQELIELFDGPLLYEDSFKPSWL